MDAPQLLVVGLLALGIGLWAALAPASPSAPAQLTAAVIADQVALAPSASTDTYFRGSADRFVQPGETIYFSGSTATAGVTQNETVRAWLLNSSNVLVNSSSASSVNGAFNLSIAVPLVEGNYTVTFNSSNHTNRTMGVVASNFTKATMNFSAAQPPFLPGDTFRIMTRALNGTDSVLPSRNVRVNVYQSNGPRQSWGTDKDNTTDANGITTHQFTIPATATSGEYFAVTDGGSLVFSIKNYSVAVSTLASNGDAKAYFAATDVVFIQAKVASNGTAVAASAITATVTGPSGGTVGSLTLSNATTGVYNASFTNLSAQGTYTISITATVNSNTITASGSFQVRSVRVTVSESSFGNFFDEWGSKKVVAPGSNLSLDIKAFDVSTGSFIKGSLSPANEKAMNCSNTSIISVKHSNGTLFTDRVAIQARLASQKFSGDSLCTIAFPTPSVAGVYSIQVNVSVNASTAFSYENATGFFSTSSFLLKVSAIGKIGKDEGFAIAKPGSNATFKLEARNVSAGSTLGRGNISNVFVASILPVGEFGGSSATAVTGVSSWFDSTKDKLTVAVPTTVSGPALVSIQGTVGGETVTGSGFFIANYLMGFAGPVGGGMAGGGGDIGGGPSGEFGGTTASCSATTPQTFFAFVMDSESAQAKSSVTLALNTVREMNTGSNVTSCFSSPGGITDSTGRAQFNVSVTNASCANSLSGFYFMLFDAAWQNLTDQVPGGFQCKRLNFWPFSSNWMLGKNSTINLTLSNIAYAGNSSKRVTNGTANITRAMNFDPGKGATALALDRLAGSTLSGPTSYLSFSPINFSTLDSNNVTWLNGFYDATVRVCDNLNTTSTADDVCDSSSAGWSVQPFQAFVNDNTIWSRNWTVNSSVGISIWSERNITAVNVTRFNFRSQEKTVILNSNCINNSATSCWTRNNSANQGFPPGGFFVTVNFSIPETLEDGQGMFEIKLNDNLTSDAVTTGVFANLKGLVQQIVVPGEIWPQDSRWGISTVYPFSFPGSTGALNTTINTSPDSYALNWNLTYLNQTHNARSQFVAGPGATGYCIFENVFNRSGPSAAGGLSYQSAMLAFANDTAGPTGDTLYLRNQTHNVTGNGNATFGPYKAGQNLASAGLSDVYVKKFEFCIPLFVSSNATEYTVGCPGGAVAAGHPVCDSQGWQTNFAFAGRIQTSSNATIPFVVSKTNSTGQYGIPNAVLNVTEVAILEKDKIAFAGILPLTSFKVLAGTTDSNGMAFVTLNVTRAGVYRLFWLATVNGQEEAASFMDAPVIEVASFNAFGQWSGSAATQTATATYQNFTGSVQAQYFNGTGIPGANVTLNYMDFSSFGPPTTASVLVSNATNGTRFTTLLTGADGSVSFNVTAASGWPTSRFGTCVNVQGTVNATSIDATLGTAEVWLGTVCTRPT